MILFLLRPTARSNLYLLEILENTITYILLKKVESKHAKKSITPTGWKKLSAQAEKIYKEDSHGLISITAAAAEVRSIDIKAVAQTATAAVIVKRFF